MNWHDADHVPDSYEPMLCNLYTPMGPDWQVLYYHPLKKWVDKGNEPIPTTHKVIQCKPIRLISREE